MTSTRTPALAAALSFSLLVVACADSRPAAAPGGGGTGLDTCVLCHGTAGRVGNLPGTDPLLSSAPPVAPSGKPATVVGAHQTHLNPPISGALRTPIACSECHVVPTTLGHATSPPASPVAFGALARAHGATPTYEPVTLGCAAVYCHGNFDYNGVKGKAATFTWNGGVVGCGDCHSLPPTGHPALGGTVTRATCSQCHPNTVNPDGTINVNGGAHINGQADVSIDCTSCHGTAGRTGIQPGTDANLAAAPPVAPAGAPSYAVGAHQPHLNPPASGSVRGPLSCTECHVVPTDAAHATTPPPAIVVFGDLAKTGGAAPTWTPTSTGCSATYCHGNFAFNGVAGLNATPLWTDGALTCGSCHGMPPTGHPPLTGTVTAATCAQCHPSTVKADGTIDLAGGKHVNGQADVVLDCTSCHGDPARANTTPNPQLSAAPPAAPAGSPASVVGTHLLHLTDNSIRLAVTCNNCHVVPTSATHATQHPPVVVFTAGTLATTPPAAPTFNATNLSCSTTYCHGAFNLNGVTGNNTATPAWNATPSLACTGCHGLPPTGHPALAGTVTAATCNQCHPSTVNANGTINVASGTHVNGVADVALNCTSCHGTAGRTGNLSGTDPRLDASPPVAVAGAPANSGVAHQFHVNPPSTGAFRGPILCNECHVVPADSTHATTPPASPVVFGTLSKTGGLNPTWNATTLGCSATYCHGSFNFNGVRGAAGAPLWSTTTITCIDCHGLPPTGHPALAGTVTPATCNQCHPSTVNANGTINVATGSHVNGQANVAANCTSCHGDSTRAVQAGNPNALLPSAPPVAPPGSPSSVVGTHLLHLTDNAIRAAVTCNSCHVVPDNPDHSIQFPPVIVFTPGTLGTTQGVAPTYNATTLSCSTTYCHGAFTFNGVTGNATGTPAWNATPALTCTGCHGLPPTGHPTLTGTVTAATCNGCHPATVKADGTIDVAGGKHMDGLSQVAGNPHTGDALWADPTHHGYSASSGGLQNCTSCHVGFASPAGTTGGSCNGCHTTAGHAGWQTECTFCHGTPGRTGTGTDARLAAAPPVGPQGQTASSDPNVGAHQRHVNPPAAGQVGPAFACVVCHASPLPSDVAHVNGQPVPIPFGGVALAPNIAYNPATHGCSATYCHGNFVGGATTAVPVWTGGSMACTSCHGVAPATGQHGRSPHVSAGCGACHSGYTSTTANPALHVNGTKNVGGTGTQINSWNAGTKSCGPQCHGTETW
jgi:predicted CxxxxCH...CXXCH cytochrome family protein